jgi:hypothetical protein
MISGGHIIATRVTVDYVNPDNIRLSYTDNNGVYNKTVKSSTEYSYVLDNHNTITGVLSNKEDWYLFWNNLK